MPEFQVKCPNLRSFKMIETTIFSAIGSSISSISKVYNLR